MTSEQGNEYGVAPSTWGSGLVVGRLDGDRTRFTDKDESEAATNMVVGAVATWVERQFGGAAIIELGDKRIAIEVAAADAPQPHSGGQ